MAISCQLEAKTGCLLCHVTETYYLPGCSLNKLFSVGMGFNWIEMF